MPSTAGQHLLDALQDSGVDYPDDDAAAVVVALETLIHQAREQWPHIAYDEKSFVMHIAERLPEGAAPSESLAVIRAEDLYLAWACANGDRAGLSAFGSSFDSLVSSALQRLARPGVDIDDAKQRVLERLLIASDERAPAIANYAGQGRLLNFVRICVVREALKLLRKRKREPSSAGSTGEELLKVVEDGADPEFASLKRRYRKQLRFALRDSLEALPTEERLILRYHYVSGLSTRKIAALVGTSFKTVARRLTNIRATLLNNTRDRLMQSEGLRKTEFESVVRLVTSQLDLSLERLLDFDPKAKK